MLSILGKLVINSQAGIREVLPFVVTITLLSSLVQAVNLPLMFRIGVIKGRMLFMAITVIAALGGMAAGDYISSRISSLEKGSHGLLWAAGFAVIVLNVVSVLASVKLYEGKRD